MFSVCADRTFEVPRVDFTQIADTVNIVCPENVSGSHQLMVRNVLIVTSVLRHTNVLRESAFWSYLDLNVASRRIVETVCFASPTDVKSWILLRVHHVRKHQTAVLVKDVKQVDVLHSSRAQDVKAIHNADSHNDVTRMVYVTTWNEMRTSARLMRIVETVCDVNRKVVLVRSLRDRNANRPLNVVFNNHVLTEIASLWVWKHLVLTSRIVVRV